jgi:hypothetical protein
VCLNHSSSSIQPKNIGRDVATDGIHSQYKQWEVNDRKGADRDLNHVFSDWVEYNPRRLVKDLPVKLSSQSESVWVSFVIAFDVSYEWRILQIFSPSIEPLFTSVMATWPSKHPELIEWAINQTYRTNDPGDNANDDDKRNRIV